jgi:hypothetical protein
MPTSRLQAVFSNRKLFQDAYVYAQVNHCIKEFSQGVLGSVDPDLRFYIKPKGRCLNLTIVHSVGQVVTQLRMQQLGLLNLLQEQFTDTKTGANPFEFQLVFKTT